MQRASSHLYCGIDTANFSLDIPFVLRWIFRMYFRTYRMWIWPGNRMFLGFIVLGWYCTDSGEVWTRANRRIQNTIRWSAFDFFVGSPEKNLINKANGNCQGRCVGCSLWSSTCTFMRCCRRCASNICKHDLIYRILKHLWSHVSQNHCYQPLPTANSQSATTRRLPELSSEHITQPSMFANWIH